MKVEHKGIVIYLDGSESILMKRVIQIIIADELLNKLFCKDDVDKLKWLDKML